MRPTRDTGELISLRLGIVSCFRINSPVCCSMTLDSPSQVLLLTIAIYTPKLLPTGASRIFGKSNLCPSSNASSSTVSNVSVLRKLQIMLLIHLNARIGHRHAWNTGKILHRDISENNLMIFQPSVTDKDNSEPDPELPEDTLSPSRGIVSDIAMASELDPGGNARTSVNVHPRVTGTLPFMARDLLRRLNAPETSKDAEKSGPQDATFRDTTPEGNFLPTFHLYRYDLESFLYILIWATTHYDLKNGVCLATPRESPLAGWKHHNMKEVLLGKELLFSNPRYFNSLKDYVLEEWMGLWTEWIKPLKNMFAIGFNDLSTAFCLNDADFDYETCGGHITFAKFMATIGEKPRGLGNMRP